VRHKQLGAGVVIERRHCLRGMICFHFGLRLQYEFAKNSTACATASKSPQPNITWAIIIQSEAT
jgi:hypothetical protein